MREYERKQHRHSTKCNGSVKVLDGEEKRESPFERERITRKWNGWESMCVYKRYGALCVCVKVESAFDLKTELKTQVFRNTKFSIIPSMNEIIASLFEIETLQIEHVNTFYIRSTHPHCFDA